MPQAIAATLIKIGVGKALAALAAKVIVNVAITIGVSMLTRALFGPKRPKPSDMQTVIRGSIESRVRRYGIVHGGGLQTFLESRNGRLGQVVTTGQGEEEEILEHRINDKVVTLDGSGTVLGASYRGAIHIYTRSGTDDQTAISQLTAQFPEWTANHRQLGCPHAAIIADPVKQKYFSEVFNGQMPTYSQVRKRVKIYDPRKDSTAGGSGAHRLNDRSTWEWSDNGPLVIADYVAHEDGYGLGYDNVNWANIAAEADIADQTVTTVTGATIARWRLWGSYKLADDERRQVLSDMMQAIDAFCWQDANFKFNLICGRFEEPDIVITDDHIKTMNATLGGNTMQLVNAVKVLYTEQAIGYREQESALVADPSLSADPNTDPQPIQAFWAPHHNQAVRIGKIMLARMGERWHLELTTNLYGLNLIGRRFCTVSSAALGLTAHFAIENGVKIDIGEDDQVVSVGLVEVRAADWEFNAATEEGIPPIAPGDTGSAPIVIPVPTGLSVSAVDIVLGSSGNAVALQASWDADRPDLIYQVQYRPTSGGTWVLMSVDDDALTARSGPVDSGTEYEVQVRAVTIGYRASAWSPSETITPMAISGVWQTESGGQWLTEAGDKWMLEG